MARKTRRMLTDEQWHRVAPHLPAHPPSPKGGRPRANDRECLEGILWLLRTGARWQDIPVDTAQAIRQFANLPLDFEDRLPHRRPTGAVGEDLKWLEGNVALAAGAAQRGNYCDA